MRAFVTITAAALIVASLTACSSGFSTTASATRSYADARALAAAMAEGGAPCTNIGFSDGGGVTGEVNPYASCNGDFTGDTAILVFNNHTDALTYAHEMMNVGPTASNLTAEVVGPNWTVNTSPAFAATVHKAVGGQLLVASSS